MNDNHKEELSYRLRLVVYSYVEMEKGSYRVAQPSVVLDRALEGAS